MKRFLLNRIVRSLTWLCKDSTPKAFILKWWRLRRNRKPCSVSRVGATGKVCRFASFLSGLEIVNRLDNIVYLGSVADIIHYVID